MVSAPPRRGLHRVVPLLAAFVVAAVVLGVLAAGLSVPSVLAVGRLTAVGDNTFMSLPSTFTVQQLHRDGERGRLDPDAAVRQADAAGPGPARGQGRRS